MATGRELAKKHSGLIEFVAKTISIFPRGFHEWSLRAFRGTKGKIGIFIRYVILKNICPSIGTNVSVHENVILLKPERMSFGSNVSIHPNCYIDAFGGGKYF